MELRLIETESHLTETELRLTETESHLTEAELHWTATRREAGPGTDSRRYPNSTTAALALAPPAQGATRQRQKDAVT